MHHPQNIWTILLTHTAVQGVLIALFLFVLKSGNRRARVAAALLILLFAFQTFNFLFEYFKWYEAYPHGIWVSAPFWYLTGALVWLFTQYSIKEKFRLKWRHIFHIIPFLFAVWHIHRFYLLPGEIKPDYYHQFFLPENYGHDWFQYGYLILFAIYLGHSIVQFIQYFKEVGEQHSHESAFNFIWIKWLLGALGIFIFISIIYAFLLANNFQFFIQWDFITYLFLSISVQIIGIAALRNPEGFFVTPLEKIISSSSATTNDIERLKIIVEQSVTHLEKEKTYLDPNLRLADLAAQLNLPAHQLSQALNKVLGKNFYEFINTYRVEEVKKCLPDPSFSNYTFAAIGSHCGFNSSASFYRIFKQISGMTPSEFKADSEKKF